MKTSTDASDRDQATAQALVTFEKSPVDGHDLRLTAWRFRLPG